jgi:K+-sensing histidine kinase KdpD
MHIAVEARAAAQSLTLVETLAHELRQPLSAIESTAYYLSMVLPRTERRAQEQASRLQRLVEQAGWILSCALQMEDASPLALEPIDVEELITQTAASRSSEGHPPLRLDLTGDLPPVNFDPGRARSLMGNLLAMMSRTADRAHPVSVRTSRATARQVLLEVVADPSPLVSIESSSEALESRLGAGAALGIESARRIVEAHHGSFEIDVHRASAVRVRILLPVSEELPNLPFPAGA